MISRKLSIILLTVLLFTYLALLWALYDLFTTIDKSLNFPTTYNRNIDSKYHGADAFMITWNGTITALTWDGKKYKIMWVKKATIN